MKNVLHPAAVVFGSLTLAWSVAASPFLPAEVKSPPGVPIPAPPMPGKSGMPPGIPPMPGEGFVPGDRPERGGRGDKPRWVIKGLVDNQVVVLDTSADRVDAFPDNSALPDGSFLQFPNILRGAAAVEAIEKQEMERPKAERKSPHKTAPGNETRIKPLPIKSQPVKPSLKKIGHSGMPANISPGKPQSTPRASTVSSDVGKENAPEAAKSSDGEPPAAEPARCPSPECFQYDRYAARKELAALEERQVMAEAKIEYLVREIAFLRLEMGKEIERLLSRIAEQDGLLKLPTHYYPDDGVLSGL